MVTGVCGVVGAAAAGRVMEDRWSATEHVTTPDPPMGAEHVPGQTHRSRGAAQPTALVSVCLCVCVCEIWNGVIGQHGVGHVNANGLRLLSLCAEHELTNTMFQIKNKYKTSWMHQRSKHWHLIDYMIVRHSGIRDVLITWAVREAKCWKDHWVILTKFKMKVCPAIHLKKFTKNTVLDIRKQRQVTICVTL